MHSKFTVFVFLIFPWMALAKTFNVEDFGAIPDGKTDSSEAMLEAWKNACMESGGKNVILIPKGTFLVGPASFEGPCKGSIEFQVEGVVEAPTLDKISLSGWIYFKNITGLMINGGGTFDGQGALTWPYNDCDTNKTCKHLPASIMLKHTTDVTITCITLINSKQFHLNINGSKNINVESIKIAAPEESPNTDGIHIGNSSAVNITDSVIGTGDDCISIGPGSSNIKISGVFCGPGHGISIGSLGKYPNEKNVSVIMVRNCTLRGTTNGLRIKTWQDSPVSSASFLSYEDVVMNNVKNPIIIDQEYCPYPSCSQKSPSLVKISDVSFSNIRGSSVSQVAVNFLCSRLAPCENIRLNNISLVYEGADGPEKSSCRNVYGTSCGIQNPPPCL